MYQRTATREASFSFANSIISASFYGNPRVDQASFLLQVRPIYVTLERTESLTAMFSNVFSTFGAQLWFLMLSITLIQVMKYELIFFYPVYRIDYLSICVNPIRDPLLHSQPLESDANCLEYVPINGRSKRWKWPDGTNI